MNKKNHFLQSIYNFKSFTLKKKTRFKIFSIRDEWLLIMFDGRGCGRRDLLNLEGSLLNTYFMPFKQNITTGALNL